jgi:hypothetical protein
MYRSRVTYLDSMSISTRTYLNTIFRNPHQPVLLDLNFPFRNHHHPPPPQPWHSTLSFSTSFVLAMRW